MILQTKILRTSSITMILPWETRTGLQTTVPKVVSILLRLQAALPVGRNIWIGVFP